MPNSQPPAKSREKASSPAPVDKAATAAATGSASSDNDQLTETTSLDDLFRAIVGSDGGDPDARRPLIEAVEAQVRDIRSELGLVEAAVPVAAAAPIAAAVPVSIAKPGPTSAEPVLKMPTDFAPLPPVLETPPNRLQWVATKAKGVLRMVGNVVHRQRRAVAIIGAIGGAAILLKALTGGGGALPAEAEPTLMARAIGSTPTSDVAPAVATPQASASPSPANALLPTPRQSRAATVPRTAPSARATRLAPARSPRSSAAARATTEASSSRSVTEPRIPETGSPAPVVEAPAASPVQTVAAPSAAVTFSEVTEPPALVPAPAPAIQAPSAVVTPAAATPPAVPVRRAAVLVRLVRPSYPEAARQQGVLGDVDLDVTINEQGRVTNAVPVSGPGALRVAAEAAVRDWRYEPATVDGVAVASGGRVRVSFR